MQENNLYRTLSSTFKSFIISIGILLFILQTACNVANTADGNDYPSSGSSGEGSDETSPYVITSSPLDQSHNQLSDVTISVTFNESIDKATVSTNTSDNSCNYSIVLTDSDDFSSCLPMQSAPESNDQQTVFTLKPKSNLVWNSTYQIRINQVIKDLSGNALSEEKIITFKTAVTEPVCLDGDDEKCIQIATFNVENFNSGDSTTKKNGIRDIILNTGFDLIALQEVADDGVMNTLVSLLGGTSTWAYVIGSSGGGQHLVFLYDKTLLTLNSSQELSAEPFDSVYWDNVRLPLFGTFSINSSGKIFSLTNLHLKAFSDSTSCTKRQGQVNNLNTWLNSSSEEIILLGDFNDEIDGYGICSSTDTLLPLEERSDYQFITTSANGFTGTNVYDSTNIPYLSVIDHIYVKDSLVDYLDVINGTNYTGDIYVHNNEGNISDHQPAYIWLRTAE